MEVNYEENKKKLVARHKAYREKNKEKIEEYEKSYREKNKEKMKLQYFLYKLFNSTKTASEYRGFYTALIVILTEYIGILYISYLIYQYLDGLDGIALSWMFWFSWYKFISPIPFGIRYFSEYIMHKPESIYNVFIKEFCTAYIVISFYRQLITYCLGVVFWNDVAIFIVLAHSLMAMLMY